MKKIVLLVFVFCMQVLGFAQPISWQSKGIGGGGALFSPSINPANPNEMYLSCDMSQLFHTLDMGKHWQEIDFSKIQGGHDSYVSFTKDNNIRYTVDYLSQNGYDYIRPMKSTDAGVTWNVVSGNPYPLAPNGGILRLIADYNNPLHVVIADYGTIYFSSDGGTSFNKIHTNVSSGAGNHIAGVFFDGANIYIGTNDGIIYSTNSGGNFNTMAVSGMGAGEYILSFAGGKKGSSVKFACLTSTGVWSGYQYGSNYNGAMKSVYTMDNANGTWVAKTGGITIGTDYPVFVGMAINCVDTMYISGGSKSGAPIVMRSVAGGNWTHTFMAAGNINIATGWAGTGGEHGWSFPEAPFGFAVSPLDAKRVVFSDYSCFHLTKDGGTNWQQKYLDSADQNTAGTNVTVGKKYHGIGLENTTNWQIMWADSINLFSAFSDINGVVSGDKGKSWKFIPNLTSNSVYRILKHTDGNLYAATSNVHDMYQTTRIYDQQINAGKGGVWYSKNNGTSFQLLHDFVHPVVWIETDPSNANRMYAAVLHSNKTAIGGIWVTNNLSLGNASTWTKLPAPPRSNGHPYNITALKNGDLVVSFSARKPTSGTAFTDSSGVYFYNLATTTWYDRSHAKMHWYTKDVVVDANDATENTWYAGVFSAWGAGVTAGSGGLYRTTDKGQNWTQISNSYRVDGVTINPGNADILYFTTETDGLYYSKNATQTSPTFSRVASYPFRHPMRVFFNPYALEEVWVSSFGSGIMVGSVAPTNGITYAAEKGKLAYEIFPNPNGGIFTISWTKDLPINTQIFITDLFGKIVFSQEKAATFFSKSSCVLDLHNLAKGMYLLHIHGETRKILLE